MLVVLTSLFIVRKFYRQLMKKGDAPQAPTEGISATKVLGTMFDGRIVHAIDYLLVLNHFVPFQEYIIHLNF